jgi:zinc-ribbon domain
MAAFCTSCGSPLGEAQAFCTKCGARVGTPQAAAAPPLALPQGAPVPPGVPPQATPGPSSVTPAAPSMGAAPAAAAKGSGAGVKILLIALAVIFLFGAIGVGAVMYIGYRVRLKAREMGLTSEAMHRRSAALSGGAVDGCKWLSKDDVSAAIGMTVVRAEPTSGSAVGCAYSVTGDVSELTMKHAMQLSKAQNTTMSKEDQQKMESIGKGMLQNSGAGNTSASDHPGEVIVLAVGVDDNAAQFQMKLNRGLLRNLGPMAIKDIPDLGDEAFALAGSMLLVRKGDALARFTFTQCPCTTDEIVPLARKLAAGL